MSQYNTDYSDSDAFLSCEEGDSDISVSNSPTKKMTSTKKTGEQCNHGSHLNSKGSEAWLDTEYYNCDLEVNMGWFHILSMRRQLLLNERKGVEDVDSFEHLKEIYEELLSQWGGKAKVAPANARNLPQTQQSTSLMSGHRLVSPSLKIDSGFNFASSNLHNSAIHNIRPLNSASIQSIDSNISPTPGVSNSGSDDTIEAIPEDRSVCSVNGLEGCPDRPELSASRENPDDTLLAPTVGNEEHSEIEHLDDTILGDEPERSRDYAAGAGDVGAHTRIKHEPDTIAATSASSAAAENKPDGQQSDSTAGASPATGTQTDALAVQSRESTNPFVHASIETSRAAHASKEASEAPAPATSTGVPGARSGTPPREADMVRGSSSDSSSASSIDSTSVPAAIAGKPPNSSTELSSASDHTSPRRKKKHPTVPPLNMGTVSDRTPLVPNDEPKKQGGCCCTIS
eukprot:m.656251 g.656251  ORF g.656251 m.656251 type:complete len:457 (-) comp22701_c0_seq1:2233-3603(-)